MNYYHSVRMVNGLMIGWEMVHNSYKRFKEFKMMAQGEQFPAKILLFGEYTILLESDALAIPFNKFSGNLIFDSCINDNSLAKKSNRNLKQLLSYLKSPENREKSNIILNVAQLESDIRNGLFFNSTIPQNYGLGSSGALVAAIYSKYGINNVNISSKELMNQLAFLESFYHSKSSGIDPLVCYQKKPLIVSDSKIIFPEISIQELKQHLGIFLVDTGNPSKTRTSISKSWNNLVDNYQYLNTLSENYIPLNNKIIELIRQGHYDNLSQLLFQLSKMQLELFKPMFPPRFYKLAQQGLQDQLFALKLCGSGGGGFLLGFTTNLDDLTIYFNKMGINIVEVG